MPRIEWDLTGQRFFETGVDHGVLYPFEAGNYITGVPWNGLSSVSENPSGAESTPIYADNIKYLNMTSKEEFGASIEAYTYPPEFAKCDGTAELAPGVYIAQQRRHPFGLSYRTLVGNDTDMTDHGYKLHLVYGAMASPTEKSYQTENDSPEAITFSWELTTTPVPVEGRRPTSLLVLDSTKIDAAKMKAVEDILYGTESTEPKLPLPDEVMAIINPVEDPPAGG